jgi:hypothetical protein
LIQTGTRDSQTATGRGIVELTGVGFSGRNTGSDSIDTNVDTWGTGNGTGLTGHVAVSYNNFRNLWGNCWEYVAGINVLADGSVRVTKQNGTGTITGELLENQFETLSVTLPHDSTTGGFISKIHTDKLGALLFLPSEIAGGNSTQYCDYFIPSTAGVKVLQSGGFNADSTKAGINSLALYCTPTDTVRYGCARLKYIPQS